MLSKHGLEEDKVSPEKQAEHEANYLRRVQDAILEIDDWNHKTNVELAEALNAPEVDDDNHPIGPSKFSRAIAGVPYAPNEVTALDIDAAKGV